MKTQAFVTAILAVCVIHVVASTWAFRLLLGTEFVSLSLHADKFIAENNLFWQMAYMYGIFLISAYIEATIKLIDTREEM